MSTLTHRRSLAHEAVTNHGTIIAIYARISRDKDNDRDGVRRQELAVRRLADKLAAEFPCATTIEVYIDNDISAVADYREHYARLTADIAARRVAIVLAYSSSRLYRDTDDESAMRKLMVATGTQLQTIKGGRVNYATADGRAQARDEASLNQRERERIAENTLASKIDDAELGKWRGGTVPLGYRRDGKYSLAIDPVTGPAVREAAEGVLAGLTVSGATRTLNQRLGLRMRPTAVRLLLLRRSLAGLIERHGEIVGEASWPGIITRDESERVRDVLLDPARRSGPGPARRHLGSGLFAASTAASVDDLSAEQLAALPRVYPSGGSRGGAVSYAAKGVNRRTDLVDRYVRGVIVERLSDGDFVELIRTRSAPEVSTARVELDALRSRQRTLVAMYADGDLTLEDMTAGTRSARARIASLEDEIAAAAKTAPTAIILTADVPAAMFVQSDVDVQRALIDMLCTVVILPTRQGRPAGWKPGQPYASADGVEIIWKDLSHAAA